MENKAADIKEKHKAVFFDRDGTLNEEVDYLYRIDDFRWLPEAVEAIQYCHAQGYLVIVVTNQSGVARGYYQEEDIRKLHEWMQQDLQSKGTYIDKFYYCPHHPEAKVAKYRQVCDCRKPKSGMVLAGCRDFNVDISRSFIVGDKKRDIDSGENAGVRGFYYHGGSLLETVKQAIAAMEHQDK